MIRAFTLIEVTVAMGIVSTGLLLLIGLMPYGVRNVADASATALERSIAQSVISDLQLNEWGALHEFDHGFAAGTPHRYFDQYGVEIDPAVDPDEIIYTVRLRVSPRDVRLDHDGDPSSTVPSGPFGSGAVTPSSPTPFRPDYSLPDDAQLYQSTNFNIRRVMVDITRIPSTPANPFNFNASSNDNRYRTYTSLMSNMMSDKNYGN